MSHRTRAILLFVVVASFTVLIFGGAQISRHKPPIPARVVSPTGEVVFTAEDIALGQRQYLSRGGQNTGSVWGHGAYLAPDWSADALHRTALVTAGLKAGRTPAQAANFTQADLVALAPGERGRVEAEVQAEIRQNRYDAATGTLTLSPGQAAAFPALVAYYTKLFGEGSDAMSIPRGFVPDPADERALTTFFWWTAWAAGTNRPGDTYSYTANFPFDPLAETYPSRRRWSGHRLHRAAHPEHRHRDLRVSEAAREGPGARPDVRPARPAASHCEPAGGAPVLRHAILLFVLQAALGSPTGHFAVEGNKLFGIEVGSILPTPLRVAGTSSWPSSGSPPAGSPPGSSSAAHGGHEPKGQKALVSGCSAPWWWSWWARWPGRTWASAASSPAPTAGSWATRATSTSSSAGSGRWPCSPAWSSGWCWCSAPFDRPSPRKGQGRPHPPLALRAVTIPLFYSAGLMCTPGSHIAVAEYWRWWVVHLWVEGFFEVFATVALAFTPGWAWWARRPPCGRPTSRSSSTSATASSAPSTTSTRRARRPVSALGAGFCALEIVPLTLVGFEVAQSLKARKDGRQRRIPIAGPSSFSWPYGSGT